MRRIWRQVIGELTGHETLERLETTIEALAANIELSGAQIKNAVLASIFIARRSREPLAMAHLLRSFGYECVREAPQLTLYLRSDAPESLHTPHAGASAASRQAS